MRDAGGELAERSELLGLHQAILRGAQIFQRKRKLLGALLHLFEQTHVLDGDDGLVGEGLNQIDLALAERSGHRPSQQQHAFDRAVAHQRHGEHRPVIADRWSVAEIIFGVELHVRRRGPACRP